MDNLKPFSESISTGNIISEESFGDIRVTSSPLGEFIPEKKKQLEKKGFSKKDIEDIEKLRKQPPAIGFTRFTNPNDWIAGGDAWNSITELGFVDIDGKGNMHPAIPAYGEDIDDFGIVRPRRRIPKESPAEEKKEKDKKEDTWKSVAAYIRITREEGGPLTVKGVIPGFWGILKKKSYRWHAAKVIKQLDVSAIDVREATQKTRFHIVLSPLQKRIIEVGWGNEPIVNYSQGEFYHKDVGWY